MDRWFVESFDLQIGTRVGAMNLGESLDGGHRSVGALISRMGKRRSAPLHEEQVHEQRTGCSQPFFL
jgi:hypothetical protein